MAKKKKVRVALRKNRQNRTRSNDLTREFRNDETGAAAAAPTTDRVRPRGELSRHRTIIEDADAGDGAASGDTSDAAAMRSIDTSACLQGRVTCIHGLTLMVRADDGRTYPCHVRRLLKSLAIEGRNVVTVGDRVWFRPAGSSAPRG